MRGNFAAPNGDYYTQVSFLKMPESQINHNVVLAFSPRRSRQLSLMRRMFRAHSDVPQWHRLCRWSTGIYTPHHPGSRRQLPM